MSSLLGETPSQSPVLADKIARVRERIALAAQKSGRREEDIRLVAVTKTISAETISCAIGMGIFELGESRIQEASAKRTTLDRLLQPHVRLVHHFIGSLQTNKAKKAVDLFHTVQSVDRQKLAGVLDRLSAERGKKLTCLIEIKISQEPTKSGIPIDEASDFVRGFSQYRNLSLAGIMTIGSLNASVADIRKGYRRCFSFFEQHRNCFEKTPVLSMGMSDDFEIAIEEGSTMVRIGRAIFGERNQP